MPKSKEFISSSEDSDSETQKPKAKKKKVEKSEEKPTEKASGDKEKKQAYTTNSSGDKMFQIARMRYATVSQFRGKVMVGIREYYDADGELRPGKKGISLSMEQWEAFKEHIDNIDAAIKEL